MDHNIRKFVKKKREIFWDAELPHKYEASTPEPLIGSEGLSQPTMRMARKTDRNPCFDKRIKIE